MSFFLAGMKDVLPYTDFFLSAKSQQSRKKHGTSSFRGAHRGPSSGIPGLKRGLRGVEKGLAGSMQGANKNKTFCNK